MGIKLFDSEWKVMDVLWRRGTDTPAREVARELEGLVGWNKNTTYTVLKKCVEKAGAQFPLPRPGPPGGGAAPGGGGAGGQGF